MSHNRVLGSLVLLIIGLCPSLALGQQSTQTNLVSNTGAAPVTHRTCGTPGDSCTDRRHRGGSRTTPLGTSTLYDVSTTPVTIRPLVVTVPDVQETGAGYADGGAVQRQYDRLSPRAPGKPAVFIFVTEDGSISGWNPGVNATAAVITVPANPAKESKHQMNAVYKSATIAREIGGRKFLSLPISTAVTSKSSIRRSLACASPKNYSTTTPCRAGLRRSTFKGSVRTSMSLTQNRTRTSTTTSPAPDLGMWTCSVQLASC